MSRYRGYGYARGASTYLSNRDEFTMTEEEKNEAYQRRKKAAEAPVKATVLVPISLANPIWPSPMSIMRFEAHGTPIPPPPEGYKGPIPERYAAHIAWPAGAATTVDAEENEERDEEAADAPRM